MKKCISFLLTLLLFFASLFPFLQTPLTPHKAYAKENCIYYIYDDQGNIRFVTDEVGNKVRSTEYDPFGNWRAANGQANIHMLYQSQQLDSESSLYYLRARYYDPLIGRFISKDPAMGVLSNPQTQNPYAYALNNPINNSDPSGEFYIPGALFLGGGLALAGMEVGGAIYGAATSCDTSLAGRAQGALTGMQQAVESPAGQVALGVATVGLMAAGPSTSSNNVIQSTGRTNPNNLNEQLALKQVMADPGAGTIIKDITMTDPRWPASEGWVKVQQIVNGINIHYVQNTVTGSVADFKFK